MRRIFSTVLGPHEPALTVGSLAISATVRPPIVPMPVTTPSAPRPSASQLASSASSTSEPSSSSRATRSRTGSLPCWAALEWWRSGPPANARSRASWTCRASVMRRSTLASGTVVAYPYHRGVVPQRLAAEPLGGARRERRVAHRVGARLRRERRARPQAGAHRADAEQEQQERPPRQRLVGADRRRQHEHPEVGDAEPRGAGHAVHRAVGDQPAAGEHEHDLPPTGRGRAGPPAEGAEGLAHGARHAGEADREDRNAGCVDELLGVPRPAPARDERDEYEGEREDEQQPAKRRRPRRIE